MTNGDKPSSYKGKEIAKKVNKGINDAIATARATLNKTRFLMGDSEHRNKLTEEEIDAAKKNLEDRRKGFYRFNTPADQAGPSGSTSTKTESKEITSLTGKEKWQLYKLKHSIKEMLKLNPQDMKPPEGNPYDFDPEAIVPNAEELRMQASAYIKSGVIDCDYSEFLEDLRKAHDDLVRYVKPGEALEEVMKLPDDPTVYDAMETEYLMASFSGDFGEAARIIRKSRRAMQLVDEAAKAGVKYMGYAEESPGERMAHAHCTGKNVYIPKAATDNLVAAGDFLFELTNGINAPKVDKLARQAGEGTISRSDYASSILEIEIDTMLRTGEIWSEMKAASENPTKLDAYDTHFHLWQYQAVQEGTMSKDGILKWLLKRAATPGETHKQFYEEQYDQLQGERNVG